MSYTICYWQHTSRETKDDGAYGSHRVQRIVFFRRVPCLVCWKWWATIMEPPFHAHEDTSCFTWSHSPGIVTNEVGIRMPYVHCREWEDNDKPTSFPAHLVFRNCCAFWRSKLYSPHPSSFGHKITPCQHELFATTLSKAVTSNWFILLWNERNDKIEDRRHDTTRK